MSKGTSVDHPGLWAIVLVTAAAAAGCGGDGAKLLTRAELMDPATCKDCHPQQFSDWSGSMHAYAAEDPVFLAMNQRAQRESNGAIGNLCVKCHAPVALAEGLTSDGLNLPTLQPAVKGVTCFFCHSAGSVEGTHNNPLKLTTDNSLYGPFSDPVAGTPHRSSYSPLFDPARPESANACGSCHDIVNKHDAAVERTFSEWKGSVFADLALGQTCARCHMNETKGPASTTSDRIRSLGNHALPGVDVALTAFPESDAQKQRVQALLDGALAGTVCLTDALQIEVTLDNVGSGHSFPSGAAPDRRAWIEVTAYSGSDVLFQSGTVPAGKSIETVDDSNLWLMRDCLFDENRNPTHMFWDAFTLRPPNLIPAPVKPDLNDLTTFTRSHLKNTFPRSTPLPARPDRITFRVILKPIGDDVLQDLVNSNDLAPDIAAAVPQFTLGGLMNVVAEWTPDRAQPIRDSQTNAIAPGRLCVSTPGNKYYLLPDAVSHARCQLDQP